MLSTSHLSALQNQVTTERCKQSFKRFAVAAWPIIDPAPLVWGWHLDAITDHLQEVANGGIRKLVINCPPGLSKSMFVCALFTPWLWATRPSKQILSASYNVNLAKRDAQKSRLLVTSDWYREHFAAGWSIDRDRDLATDYWNTKMGRRMAIGVGGGGTGQRGDGVIVDDPLKALDAYSDAKREESILWWDQTMSNRLNKPDEAFFIIIMQRLHEQDLTGHVLAKEQGYEHLRLPSEYSPALQARTYHLVNGQRELFFKDPRSVPGELLFPAMQGPEYIADQKVSLGGLGFAGQHQQSPEAVDGNLFKRAWWNFFTTDLPSGSAPRPQGARKDVAPHVPLASMKEIVMSIDTNMTESRDGSNAVIGVWGIIGADRYLLYVWAQSVDYGALKEQIRKVKREWPKCSRIIIERKASGYCVINELQREISGITPFDPKSDSKTTRASFVSPQVEAGNVWLHEGADWVDPYVAELSAFPAGRRNDRVDMTSQALICMADSSDVANLITLSKMKLW